MSGDKSLEQQKKEAAEKAKLEAKKKMEELKRQKEKAGSESEETVELAKKKAAAAAKAKAQALLKQKEKEASQEETGSEEASDLAKKKAAAAAKAKAQALLKQKEKEAAQEETGSEEASDLAKKKAAAAAKAKAQALLKQKEKEAAQEETGSEEASDLAKKKAAAAAKAKAQALAKQKAAQSIEKTEDELAKEKAKAVAAAKAKAAAAAKAKAASLATPEEPQQELLPSLNQPLLDKYVKVIQEHLGEESLEECYINRLSKDVPTLVAKPHTYFKVAEFLKYNEQLGFDYLSELHGTDFQTHFEIYVHLYSYKNRQSVALKTKIDREKGTMASIAPLWAGADWPERETYDLLGIIFEGHPNLKRIMLPDDWVGYPLRKDYEPYDVEV
ncbi:NADH-quinone oxidoreductase subunit C [Priestia abyssalis]|uniref:NADH-quinone oxidoreductase subunit C n=1 Tax=Priestia abyssalis TaxID=1221450 RepID=UPI000994D628|nr:NADH-quinone oxidoreductase subunit C [Priestia abyssalis]